VDTPTHATNPTRSAWIRSVDLASVALFAAAWSAVAWQLARALPPSRLAILCVAALPVAVLLADLVSGLVHWFADRYLDARTPLLGPMLIEPFREHHLDPMAMTRHDFFEVSGNNGLVTLPLAFALLMSGIGPEAGTTVQLIHMTVVLFAMLVFVTNQLHAWAHAPAPPQIVQLLQRSGLVLTQARHARHHEAGHDRAYCITTGLLNPLLDRARFFDRLEAALAHIGLRSVAHARPEDERR